MNFDLRGLGDDLLEVLPRFRRHNGLHLCAGVSFYALLSLPPLLYLAAALLGRVLRDDDVTERVLQTIQPLFPGTAGESLRELALELRTGDPLVLLALPALFWVSTTVFASLELAINAAFQRIPRRRARELGLALRPARLGTGSERGTRALGSSGCRPFLTRFDTW